MFAYCCDCPCAVAAIQTAHRCTYYLYREKFVDLYLNGQYGGTYQISDQVQVHKNRVEVDEDTGWLLEVANENSREEPYITSSRYGIIFNIKNPDDGMLTLDRRRRVPQSSRKGIYIQNHRKIVKQ